ncbi:MAG: hypothetical protein ACPLW7_04805, partial [Minisyncoccia bacterium]
AAAPPLRRTLPHAAATPPLRRTPPHAAATPTLRRPVARSALPVPARPHGAPVPILPRMGALLLAGVLFMILGRAMTSAMGTSPPPPPSMTASGASVLRMTEESWVVFAPSSIRKETYRHAWEEAGHPAAHDADAIYDVLVAEGVDPALHVALARIDALNIGDPSLPPPDGAYNLHGLRTFRDENAPLARFSDYPSAVRAWVEVMRRLDEEDGTLPLTMERIVVALCRESHGCQPERAIEEVQNRVRMLRESERRSPVPPLDDDRYRYDAPPSIARETYIRAWCDQASPACAEAGEMYDILTHYGIDPAIHYAQAYHETSLGRAGVGRPPIKNLHGVQCHHGDGRIGDSPVPWGNGCAGVYRTYRDSVETWARLIHREYLAEGRHTVASVVEKYAPAGADGNQPAAYTAQVIRLVDAIRQSNAP